MGFGMEERAVDTLDSLTVDRAVKKSKLSLELPRSKHLGQCLCFYYFTLFHYYFFFFVSLKKK